MGYLKNAAILRLQNSNPGYDSVIVSPEGSKKTHLTFIETRYSAKSSKNREPLADYEDKYELLMKDIQKLKDALPLDEIIIEWHYVYAIYRDTGIRQDHLKENTILLDRRGLNSLYGPSLNCLGML